MAGISQFQSVFRVAKAEPKANGSQSRGLKRNRQTVSCASCRTRKLKCDRRVPCMACSKRGDGDACSYSSNNRSGRGVQARAAEAQNRLQKLEQMVTNLMHANGKSVTNGAASPRNGSVDESFRDLSIKTPLQLGSGVRGHLDVHGSEVQYLGATNWETILENIHDIQDYLECDGDAAWTRSEDEGELFSPHTGPDLALDTTQGLVLDDVCKALPPRPVVDGLLALCWSAGHPFTPAIHRGRFKKEYESFMADPSSVSFLWISILFAILWYASTFGQEVGQEIQGSTAGAEYFKIAGQALIAGKYRKARPYAVEAILLYAHCKYMQREDPDADASIVMAVAIRLAQRMGYHRDPRHLKNISPFEGEMRRRTWVLIETFDNLLSFQAGLPTMIDEENCDVEPPGNLFDEDFDEDCLAVPPSRPHIDFTPMLYYCYKGRFSRTLKRVIKHTLAYKCPPFQVTMELDRQLDKEHAEIPPSLQWRPLGTWFTDQATQIVNRLNLETTCLKSRAILHRKYLVYERSNPAFDNSRRTSIDAALQILRLQAEIYAAMQPGGRFHNNKWLFSSIILHDFLLAAMIVCLDLHESHRKPLASTPEELAARGKEYDAICQSRDIWMSRRAISRDARRATNVLAAMLAKVPRPSVPARPPNGHWEPLRTSPVATDAVNFLDATSSSSGTSPWDAPTSSTSGQGLAVDAVGYDFGALDPLDSVFAQSDFLDWGFIDEYFPGDGGVGDPLLDWQ